MPSRRALLASLVAWTFVRPADPSVLGGRPLLDLGIGDGQTLAAVAPDGFTVGLDRTFAVLAPGSVNGEAGRLPFGDRCFATVLAADLVHHLDDDTLVTVFDEIRRVLGPGGRLVAWWYEQTSDTSPDAPRHTRSFESVSSVAQATGFTVERLDLVIAAPNSATVGLVGSV